MTRPRLLALLVIVGAILVVVWLFVTLWVNEGPLWRVVMLKEIFHEKDIHDDLDWYSWPS